MTERNTIADSAGLNVQDEASVLDDQVRAGDGLATRENGTAHPPAFLERLDPRSVGWQAHVIDHLARYQFASRFCMDKTVIDVACGNGYGTKYLSGFAEECVGVDIDAQAVELVARLYSREGCSFRQGDCRNISHYADKVDVVVSFETIEHIDATAQEEFVRAVRETLSHEGRFIASTPNRLIHGNRNPYHVNELTLVEFRALLSKHFSRVELFGQSFSCYATEHSLHHRHVAYLRKTIRSLPKAMLSRLLLFAVPKPAGEDSDRMAVEVAPWHFECRNLDDLMAADVLVAVCRRAIP